jgi:heme-degrading monooxygenase HmoA
MIITVFRSRLMPGVREEYIALVDRMVELAETMPGYVSHKGFFAEDGERVTVVEFEHEEGMRAWRMHPEHRAAQKQAREIYYSEYSAGPQTLGCAGMKFQNAREENPARSGRQNAYLVMLSPIARTAGRLMKRAVQQRGPGARNHG